MPEKRIVVVDENGFGDADSWFDSALSSSTPTGVQRPGLGVIIADPGIVSGYEVEKI